MQIKRYHYFLFFCLMTMTGCTFKTTELMYIEAVRPQDTARIFAPGFISKSNESEFGSVFSKDGKTFYYAVDSGGKAAIRFTTVENGQWTKPVTIISDEKYGFNDPFLFPSEDRLFFISNLPINEADTIADIDIWFVQKNGDKWSAPIHGGTVINSEREEYYVSFAANGAMYFSSNVGTTLKRKHDFNIYRSEYVDGVFQTPVKLSDSINTGRYEADVFIAPDESYIIFCSAKRSGFGKGDLYISFKNKDGNWAKAQNMGAIINTKNHELCPFVTADGNFLFYTSNQDIYWISTDFFKIWKLDK